jgi:hypothetical protein
LVSVSLDTSFTWRVTGPEAVLSRCPYFEHRGFERISSRGLFLASAFSLADLSIVVEKALFLSVCYGDASTVLFPLVSLACTRL